MGKPYLPRRVARLVAGLTLAGSTLTVIPTSSTMASEPMARAGALPTRGNGVIAFVSNRDGNEEIYTMYWDGDRQTRLTVAPSSDRDPAWSPDGERIAFTSNRTGDLDVWVMDGDGTDPVNLSARPGATDFSPTWSPDGTKIAFVSNRSGSKDIWVMNADGSNPKRLTKTASAEIDPSWSPLGDRIAFASSRTGNLDVWTVSATGGSMANLTRHPAHDSTPSWSPDATKIAFTSTRAGNREVHVMNPDGTGTKNFTKNPASDREPMFSPDHGTKILFTTDRGGNDEIYYMRTTDGANPFVLSHQPAADDTSADWQGLPPFPVWSSPIEHVVIIYMENQSFDGVLGRLCVEDGGRCDGTLQGQLIDGTIIDLPQAADIVPNSPHGYEAQQNSINGGLMNGFSELQYCDPPGYTCYQAYRPDQIPTVAALARTYAMSDRTFELDTVGSFGSHLNLASTILGGFYKAHHKGNDEERLPGSGCDSGASGDWQPNVFDQYPDQPTCIPFPDGSGALDPTVVPWISTIMDRMDEAGVSWKIYGTPEPGFGTGYGWAICPTFADCQYTDQRDNLVDRSNFLTDAGAGTLPDFSILTPDPPNSQHNSRSMLQGDNWIAQQVSAVMDGPNWSSSAIFLTWDDCGCFYDHVPPPPELGIREPMLIVSPYAKPGYVDHTPASFASMLTFAERVFGLAPLSQIDATAYDYAGAFDFTQMALAPIDLPTHPVPDESLRWLTLHPVHDEDDPT